MSLYEVLRAQRNTEDYGFPEYGEIVKKLRIVDASLKTGTVTVPAQLFRQMIMAILDNMEIDQERYLKENPDVARALSNGDLKSAKEHFLTNGYFEGRTGWTRINQDWYRDNYADVKIALRTGELKSAGEHYIQAGRQEGRAANKGHQLALEFWASAPASY